MAEGDEPRVPEEEIETEERHAVGHEGKHERDVIHGGRVGEGGRQGDCQDEGDRAGTAHAVAGFPKSPRGRRTRTAITIR